MKNKTLWNKTKKKKDGVELGLDWLVDPQPANFKDMAIIDWQVSRIGGCGV